MTNVSSLRQPLSLRLTSSIFLVFWCVIATFPIFWITVMSVKLPIDAFNSNPLNVIFGPTTLTQGKGLSILDITIGLTILITTAKLATGWLVRMVNKFSPSGYLWAGWIIGSLTFGLLFVLVFFWNTASLVEYS